MLGALRFINEKQRNRRGIRMTVLQSHSGYGRLRRRQAFGFRVERLAINILVGLALAFSSAGTAHAISYAYVAAGDDDAVKKIQLSNNTVVKTIAVGDNPGGGCLTTNELFFYQPNFNDDTVSVISTATDTVVATIAVGTNPHSCAVTPDGSRVWVTNSGADTVDTIATATNTVAGSAVTVGDNPRRLVVSSAGTFVYVANNTSNTVSVLNATTRVLTDTITVATGPWGIDITADAKTLYVASTAGNSIQRIDTATNTIIATLALTNADALSLTPDNTTLYASTFDGTLHKISTATFAFSTGAITVGSFPDSIAVTPDGTKVYVGNFGSDTVSVVSTTTNTVIATIADIDLPFFTARIFGTRLYDVALIPTLPEWGMILLTLSLLAIATWQLAGVQAVTTGASGTVTLARGTWITSALLGQGTATVGLGLYAVLVGPLVAHDGVGAFLAGLLIAVIIEGYRRAR